MLDSAYLFPSYKTELSRNPCKSLGQEAEAIGEEEPIEHGRGVYHASEPREIGTEFWSETVKGTNLLDRRGVDRSIKVKT
jgi:hypothetical protein